MPDTSRMDPRVNRGSPVLPEQDGCTLGSRQWPVPHPLLDHPARAGNGQGAGRVLSQVGQPAVMHVYCAEARQPDSCACCIDAHGVDHSMLCINHCTVPCNSGRCCMFLSRHPGVRAALSWTAWQTDLQAVNTEGKPCTGVSTEPQVNLG